MGEGGFDVSMGKGPFSSSGTYNQVKHCTWLSGGRHLDAGRPVWPEEQLTGLLPVCLGAVRIRLPDPPQDHVVIVAMQVHR